MNNERYIVIDKVKVKQIIVKKIIPIIILIGMIIAAGLVGTYEISDATNANATTSFIR